MSGFGGIETGNAELKSEHREMGFDLTELTLFELASSDIFSSNFTRQDRMS